MKSEYAQVKKFREKPTNIRAYLNFTAKYIPPDKAKFLAAKTYIIKFQIYDWQLNEQK